MRMRVFVAAAASIALLVGTAMLAAPGQDRLVPPTQGAERPGQATKGQVWIENRGRNESIPVVAPDPIPVIVQSRVRQWEYQTVTLTPGMPAPDMTRLLNVQGIAGWETAGVQVASGSTTLLVMKRPRPDLRFDARERPTR
jgi:hypothetical protein